MLISSNWDVVIILSVGLSFTCHSDDAPTPIAVTVAELVSLKCNSNISEVLFIEWRHDNKRIMLHDHKNGHHKTENGYRSSFLSENNSYQLEIVFNSPEDLGSYVCLQYTSSGKPEKIAWILQLEVKADNNVGNNITATVGETVTLECSSNASHLASVNWQKNGVRFIKHDADHTGELTDGRYTSRIFRSNAMAILALSHLTLRDDGNYSCLLYDASGKYFETSWILHIQDIGPDESTKTTFLGNSVTFTCMVDTPRSNLIAARWFHGSKNILHHETTVKVKTEAKYTSIVDDDQSVVRFTISLVGHDDSGKYSCLPYLENGKKGKIYWDLHVKGEQRKEKRKLLTLYGHTELDCLSDIPNVAVFKWTHNHEVIEKTVIAENNYNKQGEDDSSSTSLKLLNATFEDAGIYDCFSFSKDNKTQQTSWTLQIQGIPKVTVTTNTSKENDTINAVCCVEFGIEPVVYDIDWLLNRKRHTFNGNSENSTIKNQTLCKSVQFSVKRSNHGQSLDCWVQNELNRTSSITLNVFYSPNILQIEHYPSAHMFSVATNADVVCSVDAHPKPDVILEGESTNGGFENMSIKSQLHNVNGTISEWKFLVSIEEIHSFRCVASNAYGTTTSHKIEINCVLSCLFNGIKGIVFIIVIISFGVLTLVIVIVKTTSLLKEAYSRNNKSTEPSRLSAQTKSMVSSAIYENYSGKQTSSTEERQKTALDDKHDELVGEENYSLVTAKTNGPNKIRQQDKDMKRKPTPKRKPKQRSNQRRTSTQNKNQTQSPVGVNENVLYATVNKQTHVVSSTGLYATVHKQEGSPPDEKCETPSNGDSEDLKTVTAAELMYAKVKKNKMWRSEL